MDSHRAAPLPRARYAARAAALLCFAAALVPAPARAAGRPGIDARLASLAAIGPRAEGTAGEAAAFDYVLGSLRDSGLVATSSGFSDAEEGYSSSRIVEARLPGAVRDELAIVVPVSSWADSSDPDQGSYAIALALDEASRLGAKAAGQGGEVLPISLRFVFLGAENRGGRAGGEAASLGSRTWIARRTDRSRLAVVYLSLESAPSWVSLRSAGEAVLSPFWLYEGSRRAMERSGMDFGLDANRLQAYRLGLARDYGPSAPYLEAGIPAIELRGESSSRGGQRKNPAPGPGASPTWFHDFVSFFAAEEGEGFGETWDRHYFIFQIGSFGAVIREKLYVGFLVAVFALVSMSFLVATVARRKAAKLLLRRVPLVATEIFALFVALALVFLAGKGIARIDALILGSSESWRLFPRIFAAARVAFSFLLFLSLLSFLVEKRVLSPNPHFYELAALVCLAVDSLAFSAADLSASFYFIWALVLVELSLALRRRWATLSAYLLMYLPIAVIAAELAARPDLASYGKLIAPGYLGVLALSGLTLPFFVFTASPLLFLAKPGAAARKRAALACLLGAVAVEGFALAWTALSAPLEGSGRQDLRISESIDQDRGSYALALSGLRRLGSGSIERGGASLPYSSLGDRAYLRGEDRRVHIRMVEASSPFLDREDESVELGFASAPYGVELSLESDEDILIYDCSLPYRVSVDGRSALIFAGVNPGKKLRFSLTVPSSFRSRLHVAATYLSALGGYAQSSGAALADGGLAVEASFELGSPRP